MKIVWKVGKSMFFICAWIGSIYGVIKILMRLVNHAKKRDNRFRGYYLLENQWLLLKIKGYSLKEYFERKNIHTIAILGMDEMGNRLQEELKDSENLEVSYMIDEFAYRKPANGKVVDFEDEWEPVELFVIIDDFYLADTLPKINGKMMAPYVTLKDVITDVTANIKK